MPVFQRFLVPLTVIVVVVGLMIISGRDWPQILGLFGLWLLLMALIPVITVILLSAIHQRTAARYAGWVARHAPGAPMRRVCAMQAAQLFWEMRGRAAAERYAELGLTLCEPQLDQARVRLIYAACINVKGIIALQAGRYREALDAFSRPLRMGLEAPAQMPLFHANRAAALYNLGDFDRAVEAARHALAIMPGMVSPTQRGNGTVIARHNGALALGEAGRTTEALAETEAALSETQAQPRYRGLAWAGHGLALAQRGRHDEAEKAFAEAERGMPADAPGLLRSVFAMRGRTRLARGEDGAEADLQRAVAGDEVMPGALYDLAQLAERRGDAEQAEEWRRRLLQDAPESFWAQRLGDGRAGVV